MKLMVLNNCRGAWRKKRMSPLRCAKFATPPIHDAGSRFARGRHTLNFAWASMRCNLRKGTCG
eukprot:11421722-Karenia_brevis.AAC.1